jgi:hypothetical protein
LAQTLLWWVHCTMTVTGPLLLGDAITVSRPQRVVVMQRFDRRFKQPMKSAFLASVSWDHW